MPRIKIRALLTTTSFLLKGCIATAPADFLQRKAFIVQFQALLAKFGAVFETTTIEYHAQTRIGRFPTQDTCGIIWFFGLRSWHYHYFWLCQARWANGLRQFATISVLVLTNKFYYSPDVQARHKILFLSMLSKHQYPNYGSYSWDGNPEKKASRRELCISQALAAKTRWVGFWV